MARTRTTEPPPTLTLRDICAKADAEPQGWLLDRILPLAGSAVLYGVPGDGKTRWLGALTIAVAAGLPLAGREVKQGPVLWLYLEHPWSDLKAYLRDAARGYGLEDWQDLPVGAIDRDADNRLDIYDPLQVRQLAAQCDAAGTLLVIIDSARAIGQHNENDAAEVRRLIQACDALGSNRKRCVVLVHHATKHGDQIRGTLDFEGATDTSLQFVAEGDDPALPKIETRPHGSGTRQTWLLHADHGEGEPLSYRTREAKPKGKASDPQAATDTTASAKIRIVRSLREMGGGPVPSTKVIRAAGLRQSTGAKALQELGSEDVITSTSAGTARLISLRG